MEWFDADVSKPEQLERSSYSRYVVIWVDCENGESFWSSDRFDHISKTWERFYDDESHVTHWADGPTKPMKGTV